MYVHIEVISKAFTDLIFMRNYWADDAGLLYVLIMPKSSDEAIWTTNLLSLSTKTLFW